MIAPSHISGPFSARRLGVSDDNNSNYRIGFAAPRRQLYGIASIAIFGAFAAAHYVG